MRRKKRIISATCRHQQMKVQGQHLPSCSSCTDSSRYKSSTSSDRSKGSIRCTHSLGQSDGTCIRVSLISQIRSGHPLPPMTFTLDLTWPSPLFHSFNYLPLPFLSLMDLTNSTQPNLTYLCWAGPGLEWVELGKRGWYGKQWDFTSFLSCLHSHTSISTPFSY